MEIDGSQLLCRLSKRTTLKKQQQTFNIAREHETNKHSQLPPALQSKKNKTTPTCRLASHPEEERTVAAAIFDFFIYHQFI